MRKWFVILISFSILSCSPLRVKHVGEVKNAGKGVLYALPEDVLMVRLLIEEKHVIRGPYAAYASDLLNISGAPQTSSVSFSLKNAELGKYSQPDVNHYYVVKDRCGKISRNLTLDSQNILRGLGSMPAGDPAFPVFSYLKKNDIPEFPFPDACNDGTKKEISDTTYKMMQVDSNFVRVPVLKTTIQAKTEADRAEDAANHLMRIRKRMFKFISGAYETIPAEGNVEETVKELRREEQEYLSLFTGKEFVNTFHVKLSYRPGHDTSAVLAWFSEKQGLSAVQKPGFVPLVIETQTVSHLDTLKLYSAVGLPRTARGLVYRLPARTRVSIKLNGSLLLQRDFMISQGGILRILPAAYLKQREQMLIPPGE